MHFCNFTNIVPNVYELTTHISMIYVRKTSEHTNKAIFQEYLYVVCPPRLLNTASMRCGMLSMNFLQYSVEISFVHISLIAVTSDFALVGCFSDTLFFSSIHIFSIGFRSGLFPGQSNCRIFFSPKTSSQLYSGDKGPYHAEKYRTDEQSYAIVAFSCKTLTYFSPFIVVPGVKK